MRAKYVYEKYKREIKQLADTVRKTGKPGHVLPDKEDAGLGVTSYQEFEKDIDFDSGEVISSEIAGIHTICQIKPVGMRDLRLTCVQMNKERAKEIKKCVLPEGMNMIIELSEISTEQEPTVRNIIDKVLRKQITSEEASKMIKQKLSKAIHDEESIVRHYKKYRNSKCGKVDKLLTKIETRGSKVIEIEERSTKTIEL